MEEHCRGGNDDGDDDHDLETWVRDTFAWAAICVCEGNVMIVMMITMFLMMATSLAARPHAWYVVLSSTMSGSGGRLGTLCRRNWSCL